MTQPGQKRNYQKELDRLIEGLQREGRIPKLLLHLSLIHIRCV